MQSFTWLIDELEQTNRENEKVEAVARYFVDADASNAAWAVYLLSGRRPKRIVTAQVLLEWATEASGLPDWLVDESGTAVGDLVETTTLLLPACTAARDVLLQTWMEEHLPTLHSLDESEARERVQQLWDVTPERSRYVLNKLMTGGFRAGVSKRLLVLGLAQAFSLSPETVFHRLRHEFEPTAAWFESLVDSDLTDTAVSRPYPFMMADELSAERSGELDSLGFAQDWLAEWQWDGVRTQLIRRLDETFVWSREELLGASFPELEGVWAKLPDGTSLDGVLIALKDGVVLPVEQLRNRLNRKRVTAKVLAETPVTLRAFDILQVDGVDVRDRTMQERRRLLEAVLEPFKHGPLLQVSPSLPLTAWIDASNAHHIARRKSAAGIVLKSRGSRYEAGCGHDCWWNWKVEPLTVEAVLIYAQRGQGNRARLYSDYTFAVWDDEQLVPIAKANVGLSEADVRKIDRFVKQNTTERFGPVRSVLPELVFELSFEGLQVSSRHKSGMTLRALRVVRWQKEKQANQAHSLADLHALRAAFDVPDSDSESAP